MKPKNMPPYPSHPRRVLAIKLHKEALIKDIYFGEKSLSMGDFRSWVAMVKARNELKRVYQETDTWHHKYYSKLLCTRVRS